MTKRIFRAIITVAMVVLLACLVLVMGVLYNYFTDVQLEQLRIETTLAGQGVTNEGESYFEGLDVRGYRITWIDQEGDVLYDTSINPGDMENHLEREEVKEAIDVGFGESVRFSNTLMKRSVYSAQLLGDGTVIRVSDEQNSIIQLFFGMIQPIFFVIIAMLAIALFMASKVSKLVVAPLNNLDLDNPLENENVDELAPFMRRIHSQQRQLRIQEIELGKRKEEFEAVTKSMSEGLLLLNRDGDVLSINKAASEILGVSEFVAGKNILVVSRILEFRKIAQAALEGNIIERIIEINERDYQIDANPIYANDEISGAVVLFFDVTEKNQAEQMRREFTANVSHELKTPLHSISGCAELLLNDIVKPEDTKQFTSQIYTEAQRMMTLVNDIIYLSQLDEGALDMKRERINVYDVAKETVSSLSAEAEKASVTLDLLCEPVCDNITDEYSINGIRRLVSSIVYNLTENAIKYNREGGSVSISVNAEYDDKTYEKYVVLTVSDTGIGIPPEHQARIFERFYRVDKSHSKEVGGTGLGLSIVKHAAKAHNAEITLNSVVGGGTSVEVRFPAGK
ncbi:MAG: PAS domain S-box protein [Clostridiales bacterium]|nr:PAS domain S-box protein [Clostridiales bacterium]